MDYSFTHYQDDHQGNRPTLPSLHSLDLTLSTGDKGVGLYIEKYLNVDSFAHSFTNYQGDRSLPPLHSLNLPMPRFDDGRAGAALTGTLPTHDYHVSTYATPDINSTPPKLQVPPAPLKSMSSSMSTGAYNYHTCQPTLAETPLSTSASGSRRGFRIVPCEPERADAALLLIEPDVGENTTLLLLGPMAELFLKHGPGPIAEGARVLPYRIAPSKNPKHYHASILSVVSYKTGGA